MMYDFPLMLIAIRSSTATPRMGYRSWASVNHGVRIPGVRFGVRASRQVRNRKMFLRLGFQLLGKLVLAILFAAIPVLFAIYLDLSISFMGFPDNHVTDYEKAVTLPDRILIWISLIVAPYL